jgi:hypothetical protein
MRRSAVAVTSHKLFFFCHKLKRLRINIVYTISVFSNILFAVSNANGSKL